MENGREQFKKQFKKRLYVFTLRLINFIDELPVDSVSRRLGDQLLRSGTSIISNYVEGQAGSSRKDFQNYFNISLKSANESKLWISLLSGSKRVKDEQVSWLLKELNEISKILAASILTLKGKR